MEPRLEPGGTLGEGYIIMAYDIDDASYAEVVSSGHLAEKDAHDKAMEFEQNRPIG
ncbi:MAG: hypothetical protein JWO13_1499 [Acidobacteriales bacterium]|nr:hypothetical protein [Terriglobales bacterium]